MGTHIATNQQYFTLDFFLHNQTNELKTKSNTIMKQHNGWMDGFIASVSKKNHCSPVSWLLCCWLGGVTVHCVGV